jgi:hypothetical protein
MNTLRFAVLGYQPNVSFGHGGHLAYWDGWYSSRELAESARGETAQKSLLNHRMTFVVVERCEL